MKPRLFRALALCLILPSCTGPMSNENAQRFGALGGALGGAALGGIIGHQNGRGGEGALIGGLGGAAYGYQNGPKHLGGDGSIQQTRRTN